jgi:hypothetical protein
MDTCEYGNEPFNDILKHLNDILVSWMWFYCHLNKKLCCIINGREKTQVIVQCNMILKFSLIAIVGGESNWVHSALLPTIGLLCQPRLIMMMEKLVEWMAGETEVLGENLPQCRFVHHKSHMLCPDANPGRRGEKPATNSLSYSTAFSATGC